MALAAAALRNKKKQQQAKLLQLSLSELPNGNEAWKSAADISKATKRRTGSKNKVGDSSQSLSSQKLAADNYRQSGVVNILLYVGFILIGLGMILTLVGLGDRGFKTKELKLVGPSLIGCGVLFALLRILFCSLACKKQPPKTIDEKHLLSPSTETLTEERQTTPPPRKVSKTPKPDSPIPEDTNQDTSTTKSKPQTHSIPNLIEDEVESDADLGLVVQYVEEPDGSNSGQTTGRSFSLPDTQVPRLPNKIDTQEEPDAPDSSSQLLVLNNFNDTGRESPSIPNDSKLNEDSLTRPGEVLLNPLKLESNNA